MWQRGWTATSSDGPDNPHETPLLEPEDGRERAREEDALDGGECDNALSEGRLLVADPGECPLCLALDGGHSLDGVEQASALCRLADVRVDEE